MLKPKGLPPLRLPLAALTIALSGCGMNPTSGSGADAASGQAPAVVNSTVILGKVGALSKTSAISLTKLVLTAVSTATPPDTVRDTSAVSGNAQVTVTRSLTLKPLRTWTVSALTKDAKDSIIHSGSTSSFFVKPADTAAVTLNLSSRFAMYQANFNSLPDSISSTVSGTGKDALKIKRCTMKVDGVIKADSALASGYFSAGQTVNLYFDYLTPGSHTLVLEAYGDMHSATNALLYSGSATLSVTAGADNTQSVTLSWVGPTTGTGSLTVTIGKVGKITINGTLPGSLLL